MDHGCEQRHWSGGALELARRGADVAVSGRREERLQAVAREIEGLGRRALPLPCDVTVDAHIEETLACVQHVFGRLDLALASAGFGVSGSVEELTAADWRRQLATNVVGAAAKPTSYAWSSALAVECGCVKLRACFDGQ